MHAKFLRPYHLKLFFSAKLLHASIISKIEDKCIISTSSNNRLYREVLGEHAPKNDQRACEQVANVLLQKMKKKQVGHWSFRNSPYWKHPGLMTGLVN